MWCARRVFSPLGVKVVSGCPLWRGCCSWVGECWGPAGGRWWWWGNAGGARIFGAEMGIWSKDKSEPSIYNADTIILYMSGIVPIFLVFKPLVVMCVGYYIWMLFDEKFEPILIPYDSHKTIFGLIPVDHLCTVNKITDTLTLHFRHRRDPRALPGTKEHCMNNQSIMIYNIFMFKFSLQ